MLSGSDRCAILRLLDTSKREPSDLICSQQAGEGHPLLAVSKDDLCCGETMRSQDTDSTIQDKLGTKHAYKHCWLVETISQRLR
jgi:hypothetical protein